MFGGLSIKGQSKEEPASAPPAAPAPAQSSSSGFSFLQSSIGAPSSGGATATAGGNNDVVVVASSDSGLAKSAFGFISPSVGSAATVTDGGGSADASSSSSSSSAAPLATAADGAAMKPAPQSIFDGLNSPHSAKKSPSSQMVAPSSSSGFSFLSSTPISPIPIVTAAAAAGASVDALDAETNHNITIDATTKSTTMSTAASSSFSFMNSLITTSSSSVASSSNDNGEFDSIRESGGGEGLGKIGLSMVHEETAAGIVVAASGSTGSDGVGGVTSGFSFLSFTPENAVSSSSMMMGQPPQPSQLLSEAVVPPPPSDLLSISNATLPVGSGVAWSSSSAAGGDIMGATGKKVVKKKRGKRVGIGSSSGSVETPTTSYPYDGSIPEPSSLQHQQPTDGSFQSSTTPFSNNTHAPPPPPPIWRNNTSILDNNASSSSAVNNTHDSPPMRIKAERAMDKAEEFIREKQKQRNAIALAAERAMLDRSVGDNAGRFHPFISLIHVICHPMTTAHDLMI